MENRQREADNGAQESERQSPSRGKTRGRGSVRDSTRVQGRVRVRATDPGCRSYTLKGTVRECFEVPIQMAKCVKDGLNTVL